MNIRKESLIDPALAAGRDLPAAATRPSATKFSGFFLTYVCNTQFGIGSDDAKDFAIELKNAVDNLIDNLHLYIDFNKGSLSDIVDVQSLTMIELGKKTGHVHAHIKLDIWHNANIRLSNTRIKAALNEALGIQGHFDNKIFLGPQAIENYLKKTLLTYS